MLVQLVLVSMVGIQIILGLYYTLVTNSTKGISVPHGINSTFGLLGTKSNNGTSGINELIGTLGTSGINGISDIRLKYGIFGTHYMFTICVKHDIMIMLINVSTISTDGNQQVIGRRMLWGVMDYAS